MKKDIIESLRYSANLLGWLMGQNQGKWKGFGPDANALTPKVVDNSTLKWMLNPNDPDGAYIMFKDIRPNKISDTVYDDPKIISSETKDAYSSVASNLSDTVTMNRTYSITEGSSASSQNDVGVSVGIGISQEISYGGEASPVSGKTEFSINIQTSFNHGWTEGESTERTIETSIEIPPLTKTTLTATKSRSKLRQNIHFTCDLDYSIKFESYGVARFYIESREALEKAFDGEYYDGLFTADAGDSNAQERANWFGESLKDQPKRYKAQALPEFNTKFTKEIKFDKSVTGEVILKSQALQEYINNGVNDFMLNEGTNPKTYTNSDNDAEILTVEQMQDYVAAGTWYQSKLLVQYK